MTLTFEQLMETNLRGYTFCVTTEGYTRSGYGTIDEYYVVLEDGGENCVIADFHNRSRTMMWTKNRTAANITKRPLLKWNEETKRNENNVEIL